ncbi:MAG: FHA domain-containing protein [Deltaproteobacteria bacterium]|nr:FHA domain-containing protein [Deltaproteobacteria bacterium]
MAWLERGGANVRITLAARSLVGRAPHCLVRPDDRRVSGEHATIAWTAEHWAVRDLGSRNGTFVDGARIEVGSTVRLGPGSTLGFGGTEEAWVFADASPPVATARNLDGGAVEVAEAGLLALPSGEEPRVCVSTEILGRVGWRSSTATPNGCVTAKC